MLPKCTRSRACHICSYFGFLLPFTNTESETNRLVHCCHPKRLNIRVFLHMMNKERVWHIKDVEEDNKIRHLWTSPCMQPRQGPPWFGSGLGISQRVQPNSSCSCPWICNNVRHPGPNTTIRFWLEHTPGYGEIKEKLNTDYRYYRQQFYVFSI